MCALDIVVLDDRQAHLEMHAKPAAGPSYVDLQCLRFESKCNSSSLALHGACNSPCACITNLRGTMHNLCNNFGVSVSMCVYVASLMINAVSHDGHLNLLMTKHNPSSLSGLSA